VNSNKIQKRLEVIAKTNREKPDWVNRKIFKLLTNIELLKHAYNIIKSNPGNMTPGSDNQTIDGMSLKILSEIIRDLKSEKYQFTPVKRIYIPKKNGKTRPLGLPAIKDKIIQKALQIILEAIYEPIFSNNSHGFRPGRSCHSALGKIYNVWTSTKWFIEGDVEKCFDSIDHHLLMDTIRKKIDDPKLERLLWKILRAGYLEFKQHRPSLIGIPQGSIIGPTLANIYLHEFDLFVDTLIQKYTRGTTRRINKEYQQLSNKITYERKMGRDTTILQKKLSGLIKSDHMDPNYIRVRYVRYADDWLIGIIGPYKLAQEIKAACRDKLEELKLTLNTDKTIITKATTGCKFLGCQILATKPSKHKLQKKNGSYQRLSAGRIVIYADVESIRQKLINEKFCDKKNFPQCKGQWINLSDEEIIQNFSSVNRGIYNYYKETNQVSKVSFATYILEYSLAKTLAGKHKTSISVRHKMPNN